MRHSFFLAFCLITVLGAELRAGLIDVDFKYPIAHPTIGNYSGAAQIGAAGDIWNAIDIENDNTTGGTGLLSLTDISGSATGVTISMAASSDGCCFTNATGWDPTNGDSPNYGDLMAGMTQNSGMTLTLAGLTPGTYVLWVYTPFGLGDMTANLASVSSLPYDVSDRLLSTHSQMLDPVVLDDGLLTISSDQRVSGFQLEEPSTPEPSTVLLFAVGIALLVTMRRRRHFAQPEVLASEATV